MRGGDMLCGAALVVFGAAIWKLIAQGETLMSKFDELKSAIEAEHQQIAEAVENIRQDIAEIKAMIPAPGDVLTDEQVAELKALVDGLDSQVSGLASENPAIEEPTDPEAPEEPTEPTEPEL
jgi:hypothetical protein